ncbi:MAG: tRNA-specific adenosine deaminase [Cellvibrionales bacterium TMED49]|nr:tRNA-specific adenosine deaminase [Porticoccaceae bacterium]OUU38868.1 MAG: tRNA-specific adenosine deaminase [Cellvibrionales bacterium TMED49]
MNNDKAFMDVALENARLAMTAGEVPIGAVLVRGGEIIAHGHNEPILSCDPTAHAEIVVLRKAAIAEGNYRLVGSQLFVTIEPCIMCVGAMLHSRVSRIIFGAKEPRFGALTSNMQILDNMRFNHKIEWHGGVLAEQSSLLMHNFFQLKRGKK